MSREVKIQNNMPEKQKPLFSEGMSKLVATTIGLLLIAVIGQGLIIWKNQDSILKDISGIKENITVTHVLSDRLIKLEGSRIEAFGRIDKLENTEDSLAVDRSQRGGSYRRNDADLLEKNILGLISVGKNRLSSLEYKMGNAESRINECRLTRNRYALQEDLEEVEEIIEELEEEHETTFAEISTRCDKVIKMLGGRDEFNDSD